MRIGVMVGPERGRYATKVDRLRADARWAEEAGLATVWVPPIPDEVDARLELGLERQAVLTRDPHPLRAHFVLDESVLHRLVGGPEVMADQLDHLADAAGRRTVTVQVVPFAHGAHPEAAGAFTLLDFGAPGDPGVAYVEGRVSGEYVEGPAEVEDHATVFDQLGRMARVRSDARAEPASGSL